MNSVPLNELAYDLRHVSLTLNGVKILQDLTLAIEWGERVAIIGSSGAGKSSLLQLLNGALEPSQGSMRLVGRARNELNRRQLRFLQRQIGTIYQQFHLIHDLRVIHNVNAGNLARWPVWKALWSLIYPLEIHQAHAVLAKVGMAEHLFSPTAQLSGGQQQRVAIARILIQNPMIVLADEPVSSLDPQLSDDIMVLLMSLLGDQPRTLIASLHDVDLAKQYCDRIVGLKAGCLLFDLPSHDVSQECLSELYGESQLPLVSSS